MKIILDFFKKKRFALKDRLRRNGFTLIETIVGVAILASVLLGPVTVTTASIRRTAESSDRLTALYLAQEGTELIRIIRENNILKGAAWNEGLPDGDYEFDFQNSALAAGAASQPPSFIGTSILFDSATGAYGYTAGSPSKFTRKITVIAAIDNDPLGIPAADQMDISVVVSWQSQADLPNKTVQLQERLYNWQ